MEERKIYDLVVRRFIAVLYPPFEYEQTELTVELAGENFAAKGKIVKNAGWREVYDGQDDDEDDEEAAVSDLKQHGVAGRDLVIGIAASGRTPYTLSLIHI